MKRAVKVFHSLQDLSPEILQEKRVRRRIHVYRPSGILYRESVEYRIYQKRKEIAALDREMGLLVERPKVKMLRYKLFGEYAYRPLSEREELLVTGWQFEEVEVDL